MKKDQLDMIKADDRKEDKRHSKYRYQLVFPCNYSGDGSSEQKSLWPMFDRSRLDAVLKTGENLALAMMIDSLRIDGFSPDGCRFTAATWSPKIGEAGGWRRWLTP